VIVWLFWVIDNYVGGIGDCDCDDGVGGIGDCDDGVGGIGDCDDEDWYSDFFWGSVALNDERDIGGCAIRGMDSKSFRYLH